MLYLSRESDFPFIWKSQIPASQKVNISMFINEGIHDELTQTLMHATNLVLYTEGPGSLGKSLPLVLDRFVMIPQPMNQERLRSLQSRKILQPKIEYRIGFLGFDGWKEAPVIFNPLIRDRRGKVRCEC